VKNQEAGIRNLIFTDSVRQSERLYAIFNDLPGAEKDAPVPFSTVQLAMREGFVDLDLQTACYTDHQIFDRYYKYRLRKGYSRSQAITLKELRELKPGDFITHIDHGIGKYAGLEKFETDGRVQEMIRLVHADNDLLYVNINSLNRISRYTGKEGTAGQLPKDGIDAWDKVKTEAKREVDSVTRYLIKVYAMRESQEGYVFMPGTELQHQLEASYIDED